MIRSEALNCGRRRFREKSSSFSHLLSAGGIGSLQLRNRIIMAPMGSNLAESSGHTGERIQRYYEERARGGAGLLIVETSAVAYPEGAHHERQVGISDDTFVSGLKSLAESVS